jgi:xanthine dehydrogenase accessory factor
MAGFAQHDMAMFCVTWQQIEPYFSRGKPMTTIYEALRDALAAEQPAAVATVIAGDGAVGAKLLLRPGELPLGTLGDPALDTAVAADALSLLTRAENEVRGYATSEGEAQVFIETYPPPPTLFVVGAVHIAIPLVTFAKTLGFRTVVVDARSAFATPERFAHADELIHAWPDEVLPGRLTTNSFVVLLTHDPKLDDPALLIALPSQARYVGALGSPKTHAKRLERLRAEGVPEEQLARLHAPVGLKLGGRTPEEIAVSIIAEIVAARHGLTGR